MQTPDMIVTVAGYVSREWGDYGYAMEPTNETHDGHHVWNVLCTIDGSRFRVGVDRNCNTIDIP